MEKSTVKRFPAYKSNEFFATFSWTTASNENTEMIKKLTKDGELISESQVTIERIFGDGKFKYLKVVWKRETLQGIEAIPLWRICPTDGFLEFLDRFGQRKGIFVKHWEVSYGLLNAACEACKNDADAFRDLVRKANDADDLIKVLGFR